MIDLYTVAVPILGVMTLLGLLVLKLAIRDNVTLGKIKQKSHLVHKEKMQCQDESPTKNTIKYLLLNFTPIEICAVRRAKYKLCLMLSLSVITMGTYFVPSPYYFVGVGTMVYFTFFFVAMAITRKGENENEEVEKQSRLKYLYVILGVLTMALNFAVIGMVFKSYQNSMLGSFLANAGINIVFDNFLVRPTMTLIMGLPLSLSSSFYEYVQDCQIQITLLERYQTVGEKEMFAKPEKMLSPSKITKRIPINLEIEPKPVSQEMLRNKENEGQSKGKGLQNPLELLKKIKREKQLAPINLNLQQSLEFDGSLNSLLNSTHKDKRQEFQEPIQDQTFGNQQTQLPKKKISSDHVIQINPSHQEEMENQEDIVTEHISGKKGTFENEEHENGEDYEAYRKRGATFSVGEGNMPLKISINDSEHPTSRQEPLRISLNDELNIDFDDKGSDEDGDNFKRRRDLMTIDDQAIKNHGVLEIKDHNFNHSEEIEEIDLNSPQRRRRQGLHIEYEVESKIQVGKKKKKKLSHDHQNHRVIKFSTGEPYLEYLPNMLSKDAKNKKSQALSRKEIIDPRVVSSVKRAPKRKVFGEHNQNILPEFNIEEL